VTKITLDGLTPLRMKRCFVKKEMELKIHRWTKIRDSSTLSYSAYNTNIILA
jgi:hypothetical protein